jgi:hypothetical protein
MLRYKNLNGNSGVHAYEIGIDQIVVQFTDGSSYLYDYKSSGSGNVEQMKTLAKKGHGLGTFINKYVGKKFARKF